MRFTLPPSGSLNPGRTASIQDSRCNWLVVLPWEGHVFYHLYRQTPRVTCNCVTSLTDQTSPNLGIKSLTPMKRTAGFRCCPGQRFCSWIISEMKLSSSVFYRRTFPAARKGLEFNFGMCVCGHLPCLLIPFWRRGVGMDLCGLSVSVKRMSLVCIVHTRLG